jgi:predicted nucleic acid-binding protein
MYFDIKNHQPTKDEKYFVDTNVWYWMTYVSSKEMKLPNEPREYQKECYPQFIQNLLDSEAELYFSPLILAELASVIEQSEFEIYKMFNPEERVNKKQFRKKPLERKNVIKEVKTAWSQITSMSKCIDTNVNKDFSERCLKLLEETQLDGYDSFYIDTALKFGIINIITDDKDFRTSPELAVYSTYG